MRTNESVRAEAVEHFNWRIEYARRRPESPTKELEEQELGLAIVDAALALAPGELLDITALLPAELTIKEKLEKALRVIPYVSGSLRLLDMEFAHATAGVIPTLVVRDLWDWTEPEMMYEGHALTRDNVYVQYRRLALV